MPTPEAIGQEVIELAQESGQPIIIIVKNGKVTIGTVDLSDESEIDYSYELE